MAINLIQLLQALQQFGLQRGQLPMQTGYSSQPTRATFGQGMNETGGSYGVGGKQFYFGNMPQRTTTSRPINLLNDQDNLGTGTSLTQQPRFNYGQPTNPTGINIASMLNTNAYAQPQNVFSKFRTKTQG